MREISTVTRKGQVTIPAELRKSMGIKRGDKISFILRKKKIELSKAESVVEKTKGILKGNEKPLTAKEMRRIAEQVIADAALERSK